MADKTPAQPVAPDRGLSPIWALEQGRPALHHPQRSCPSMQGLSGSVGIDGNRIPLADARQEWLAYVEEHKDPNDTRVIE